MEYSTTPVVDRVTEYNSAGLINKRLHDLWVDCHMHRRKGMFSNWNADLDSVWFELVGSIKIKSEVDTHFRKINERVGKLGIKNWNNVKGFNGFSDTNNMLKSKQYDALFIKEEFLRRLMDDQGKGVKTIDEEDWE